MDKWIAPGVLLSRVTLTHCEVHADCACVPPHAASGALYSVILDPITKSEEMRLTAYVAIYWK